MGMLGLGGDNKNEISSNLNGTQTTNASSNNNFNISFGDDGYAGGASNDNTNDNTARNDNTTSQTQKDELGLTASVGVGVGGAGSGGSVSASRNEGDDGITKPTDYPEGLLSGVNSSIASSPLTNNQILSYLVVGAVAIGFLIFNKNSKSKKGK